MKKKTDLYLKVVAGAFVARSDRDKTDNRVKMVFKVQGEGGDEVIGFSFDRLAILDSCISTLERLRDEFLATDQTIHPSMSEPTGPQKH